VTEFWELNLKVDQQRSIGVTERKREAALVMIINAII
jgi:hypothetical protein